MQQLVGLFTGSPGASGSVTARAGDTIVTSPPYTRSFGTADSLAVALATRDVYYDNAEVAAWVQVADELGATAVRPTTVVLAITSNVTGGAAVEGTCVTSQSSGRCRVTVPLPPAWFDAQAGAALSVQAGLGSSIGGAAIVLEAGTVRLHASVDTDIASGILAELPARPLFPGETFQVPVRAQGGAFPINSWQLVIRVASGALRLDGVNVARQWSADVLQSDAATVAITAGVADFNREDVLGVELLATATVTVLGSAATDAFHEIRCEVLGFFNSQQQQPLTTPTQAVTTDRRGRRVGAGAVFVAEDVPRGLLLDLPQAEIANLAPLDGLARELLVQPQIVSLSGALRPASVAGDALTCSTQDATVATFSSACDRLRLTADAAVGSPALGISVRAPGLSPATGTVRIWLPARPAQLSVNDATLQAVEGWRSDAPGCAQRYQSTRLRAVTSFDAGDSLTIASVDVTPIVAPLLRSEAGGTGAGEVAIDVGPGGAVTVTGVAEGVVTLVALRPSDASPSAVALNISISNDAVSASSLAVTIISGASMGGVPAFVGPNADQGAFTAQVTAEAILLREFQRADVVVAALLSDGHREALTRADGVVLVPVVSNLIRIANDTAAGTLDDIEARGSGKGAIVRAEWHASDAACGGATPAPLLAQGIGYGEIALPPPERVIIVPSSRRLAPSTDPAAALGSSTLSTEVTLRVFLEFEGGRRQEMTNDPRTILNATRADALGRLVLQQGDGPVRPDQPPRVVTESGEAGEGGVHVSFLHVNITATVTLEVVRAAGLSLAAVPYPAFAGSVNMAVDALRPLGGSGVWQQAALRATLRLSDGSSVDVSRASATTYEASPPATLDLGAAVGAGAAKDRVAVAGQPTSAQAASVTATFASQSADAALPLQVRVDPVAVSAIIGMQSPSTLRGGVDSTAGKVTCGLAFEDGTRWERASLFPDANPIAPPALANLVRFAFENGTAWSAAASVDTDTGLLMLHDNAPATLTLSAGALDSGVRAEREVACNLDPVVGDADLGDLSGVPVARQTVNGAEFSVPVRLNLGSARLAAIELAFLYDDAVLEAVSAEPGAQWPGGPFERNLDTPGVISAGGASDAVSGTAVHLMTLTFRVRDTSAGITSLEGTVVTLSDADSVDIGASASQPAIVAGRVDVLLGADAGPARRRRGLHLGVATGHHQRLRRAGSACQGPLPCSACSAGVRETGDANGDCIFDVKDAAYTRRYLNLIAVDPGNAELAGLLNAQLRALDADRNGAVNAEDAVYSVKVNFGLYYFVASLDATPVGANATSCLLDIRVALVGKGDVPAAAETTVVFFDVESTAPGFASQFAASTVIVGEALDLPKGDPAYHGGLWRAVPLAAPGVFGVRVRSAVDATRVGISLIQATLSPSGVGARSRTSPLMTGNPDRQTAPEFSGDMDFELEINTETPPIRFVSDGYNPLVVLAANQTTAACNAAQGVCSEDEYAAPPNGACVPYSRPCTPEEVEVVPPSPTSDRVCAVDMSDGVAQFPAVRFGLLGGAAFLPVAAHGANRTSAERNFRLAAAPAQLSGTVQLGAALGAFATPPEAPGVVVQSVSCPQTAEATTAQAWRLSPDQTLVDSRRVHVRVQLGAFDAGQRRVKPTALRLQVSPGAVLQQNGASGAAEAQCTTDASGGCVLSVTLPAAWFAVATAPASAALRILAVIPGNTALDGALAALSLADITIVPRVDYTPVSDVAVMLPQGTVFAGESFTASVVARAGDEQIATFSLTFEVDAPLELVDITLDDNRWSASTVLQGRTGSIVANLADLTGGAGTGVVAAAEEICALRLRVSEAAQHEGRPEVRVTVNFLSNVQEAVLIRGLAVPQPAIHVTQQGANAAPAPVVVVQPQVAAASVVAGNLAVIHTAEVRGDTATAVSLSATAYLSNGGSAPLAPASAGWACRVGGNNSLVVSVDSECTALQILGNSVELATVELVDDQGAVRHAASVSVWQPVDAPALSLDDAVLNRVQGVPAAASQCDIKYQSAAVRVTQTFAAPVAVGGGRVALDLTALAAARLRSSNAGVAAVQAAAFASGLPAAAARVAGLSVGTASLSLPGTAAAPVEVTVSDTPVTVARLDVTVLESLALTVDGVDCDDAAAVATASVTYRRALTREGQEAFVYAAAIFSDGQRRDLGAADGLRIGSLNPRVVDPAISGLTVYATGSGGGALVNATWAAPVACGGSVLAVGAGDVTVSLPLPEGAAIDRVAPALAVQGDVASALDASPLPTTTGLRVRLLFAGYVQDVTADSRTRFDLSGSNGLFTVSMDGGVPRIVSNSDGRTGQGVLRVTFEHVNVTAGVALTVVESTGVALAFRPFPAYSGSGSVAVETLRRIEQTNVWQEATLQATLSLSDGTTRDVSGDSNVAYRVYSSPVVSTPGGPAVEALVHVAGTRISRPLSAGILDVGTVYVDAGIGALASPRSSLTITSSSVNVTALTGLSFVSTLRGQAGNSARPAVGALLSDGRRLPQLVESSGAQAFPGLLTWSLLQADGAAAVDPATGRVTLAANSYRPAMLRVQTVTGQAEPLEATFACNLDPVVGDVDLGATTGVPVPALAHGETFTLPILVNTGAMRAGAIDIAVEYDATILQAEAAQAGDGWPGGNFLSTLNDPPGQVRVGGAASGFVGLGTLATVTFRVLSTEAANHTDLLARVLVLATVGDQASIGGAVPREATAGNVRILLTSGDVRRRRDHGAAFVSAAGRATLAHAAAAAAAAAAVPSSRHRRASCVGTDGGCSQCLPSRPLGDANGDCEFDIRDAAFLRERLAIAASGQTPDLVASYQEAAFDADGSGEVNPADPFYLARVSFNLLRFVSRPVGSAVAIGSAAGADCMLIVEVQVLDAAGDAANTDTTFVHFLLTQPGSNTSVSDTLNVVEGVALADTGAPAHLALVRAKPVAVSGGMYRIAFEARLGTTGLPAFDVAVLLATTDTLGESTVLRTALLANSTATPSVAGPVAFSISLGADASNRTAGAATADVSRTRGYTPLATVGGAGAECAVTYPATFYLPISFDELSSLARGFSLLEDELRSRLAEAPMNVSASDIARIIFARGSIATTVSTRSQEAADRIRLGINSGSVAVHSPTDPNGGLVIASASPDDGGTDVSGDQNVVAGWVVGVIVAVILVTLLLALAVVWRRRRGVEPYSGKRHAAYDLEASMGMAQRGRDNGRFASFQGLGITSPDAFADETSTRVNPLGENDAMDGMVHTSRRSKFGHFIPGAQGATLVPLSSRKASEHGEHGDSGSDGEGVEENSAWKYASDQEVASGIQSLTMALAKTITESTRQLSRTLSLSRGGQSAWGSSRFSGGHSTTDPVLTLAGHNASESHDDGVAIYTSHLMGMASFCGTGAVHRGAPQVQSLPISAEITKCFLVSPTGPSQP
jgi:hypothetical protein